MARRFHIVGPFITIVTAVLGQVLAGPEIIKGPYVQNVQPDRVTIMWETDQAAPGVVFYGPTEALGLAAESAKPARMHEVTLAGLRPRTEYRYRVQSGSVRSGVSAFTTAFDGEGAFTFAAYGDTRDNPGGHAAVIRLMAGWRPAFVIHTGDLVGNGSDYDEWGEQFFDPAAVLMRTTCFWPVLGNHEEDADHYYRFFALPGPERWYTFTWGSARFIALDSNRSLSGSSEQIRWLRSVLEQNTARWTFVVLHEPLYSSGTHGGSHAFREALLTLMEKHRVDLVFAGHNHIYERTYPIAQGRRDDESGIVYVTTAGGGAPLYAFRPDRWTAVAASELHACRVHIDGPNLTLEAQNLAGTTIDLFERTKDAGRLARLEEGLRRAEPGAIAEVGRLGLGRLAPHLVRLLTGGDLAARRAAAEAFARLNLPVGAEALATVARDADTLVRQFAIRGLAQTGDAQHLPRLIAALEDPTEAVALEAVRGLAWMADQEGRAPLVRLLNRTEASAALRSACALALGQITRGRPLVRGKYVREFEDVLLILVDDADLGVAREAARGLARHDTPEARLALMAGLGRPYLAARSKAHDEFDEEVLQALRKIADRSCGDALLDYLRDPRRRVSNRERAARILDQLTGLTQGFDAAWTDAQLDAALERWREALKGR